MTLTDATAYVLGMRRDDRTPHSEEEATWGRIHRSVLRLPEHALMLALIEDGIDNALNGDRKEREEAWAWIDGADYDPEYVFTFANCCMVLDLNPDYLRKGIKRSKEASHDHITGGYFGDSDNSRFNTLHYPDSSA